MSILVQIIERSCFLSKFSKIVCYSDNLRNKSWFHTNFRKNSENFELSQKSRKILENPNIIHIFEKPRILSKFPVISILVKISNKT